MKRPPRVILLVPNTREFERGFRRGVFRYAHEHGPWTILEEAPMYLRTLTPRQRLGRIKGWAADGMMAMQSRLPEVRALRIPQVVAIETDRLGPSHYQVICADEEIGRMGAKALIGLGFRNFAYCGFRGLAPSELRGAGFEQTLAASGHAASIYSCSAQSLEHSWYVEEKPLARWLAELPKPVGVMASNDDRARMLAEICCIQGLQVPGDVAIMGVDNDEQICLSARPPLSSIALATEQGGYEAAALLAAAMAGREPANRVITVLPTHVVNRQSSDILAIEDVQVGEAVQFIRENSNRKIRVADLIPIAGLSRRALQDAFVRNLGRTPLAEIHNSRVDHIAKLLVETNLPVGKIAEAAGFEIDAHLARFFSRRTGMSPLAYRKKHRLS